MSDIEVRIEEQVLMSDSQQSKFFGGQGFIHRIEPRSPKKMLTALFGFAFIAINFNGTVAALEASAT